ncbi:hypothetical protein PINS_up014529 [Pythium insidiosum]|nr:hypothetical protein PINS_up014529 [Pythium insidiosum]
MRQAVHPMSPLPKRDPSSEDDEHDHSHSHGDHDLEHRIAEPETGSAPIGGPSGVGMGSAQDPQSPGPPGTANDPDGSTQSQQQPWNRAKSGRRLVFADESGGVLAEISYSNRTHYSKQSGSGQLPGGGRGCCVIS